MNPVLSKSPVSQRSHVSPLSLSPPHMPQSNSSASQDHKIVRKRNRVPLSCNFCRQRKLKCNRGHPCENCVKRGDEGGCVYLMGNNGAHSAVRAAVQQGLPESSFVNGATNMTKRATGVELQNRLDKLESLVLGLMHSSGAESESPRSDEGIINQQRHRQLSTGELAPDVDAVRESLGMMKLDRNGMAMYHGETHWGALLNELSEVRALFEANRQHWSESGGEGQYRKCISLLQESDFPFTTTQKVERSDILGLLPSKADCDVLVYRYFDFFDPIYHIVHKPSFEDEYARFWSSPDDTSVIWIGMLLSMLAIALQSYRENDAPEPFKVNELDTWRAWQNATEVCLVQGKFMLKGSIVIIRTLTLWIMVETRGSVHGNWMNRTWVAVGLLIRLAQSMGLHRDPKWFNIMPFEAEIRRQIWCVVTSLDVLFSVNEGLPLTIRAGEHDVRLPLNVDDTDISPEMQVLPDARPWELGTNLTFLLCHSRIANVLCRIVSGTYSLKPRPSYDTILSHDAELRATYAGCPEYLRVPPESSNAFDPAHIIMQRCLLDLQFRKALIVLHRPFAARADENVRYKRSKEECMDASLQILRRQSWLYTSPAAQDTLRLFSWFTDGLMINHFFHACIMLCVELYTNMDSMSVFQRQTVRDAVDACQRIHEEIGKHDMAASKKHGLIVGLLERFHETEKLSPEERAKVQSNMSSVRRHLLLYDEDHDAFRDDGGELEFAMQQADITSPVAAVESQAMAVGMNGDSDGYDVTFLPEEDEIYIDAPFRLRRLPDPQWLQQVYASPPAAMTSVSESGNPGAIFLDSIHGNGMTMAKSTARPDVSAAAAAAAVAVAGPSGTVSPEGQVLTTANLMLMTQSPENEVSHAMNWEEWDIFMQGMDTNPTTWNSVSASGGPGDVMPSSMLNHVVPVMGWEGGMAAGLGLTPGLTPGMTPEAGMMDTSGLDDGMPPGNGIGYENNGAY
ncbi:fungal-specific transcription factor domain-containing protein [Lipomyces arxii]|uniref:fungal-specific transcription factor domain-containing protein n=1 Tax=Lipomyces arxii TaxID=56418 RepID=UPI0034CE1D57